MVDDYVLHKVLDKIKEIIGIDKKKLWLMIMCYTKYQTKLKK